MSDWQKADLHIHSALSPCADREMTPRNIVNMAKLLGLGVIAVTDHQAAMNVSVIVELAAEQGIICLPGLEVQTLEEVHLLAYFPDLPSLHGFEQELHLALPRRWPVTPYFGQQLVFDRNDRVVEEYPWLLHQSVTLTVSQVWALADRFLGCIVPAHLDRHSFSLKSQLGFIPESLPITAVEYSQAYLRQHRAMSLAHSLALTSSDAHSLREMVTPGNSLLHITLRTPHAICQALRLGDRQFVRAYCPNF